MARPQQRWSYEPDTDLAALAASYAFGIAKNHPFVDGNKRAALVAAYTFLAINGWELEAPEPETVGVILGIADGSLSEENLGAWIRSHLIPWAD
jgi:death-on-curing protein